MLACDLCGFKIIRVLHLLERAGCVEVWCPYCRSENPRQGGLARYRWSRKARRFLAEPRDFCPR